MVGMVVVVEEEELLLVQAVGDIVSQMVLAEAKMKKVSFRVWLLIQSFRNATEQKWIEKSELLTVGLVGGGGGGGGGGATFGNGGKYFWIGLD